MGLLKKLVKAYKDDRKETQAFLARVEAQKAREASPVVSLPKEHKPPFMFIGAPIKIGDMTQAYRYGIVLDSPDHDALKAGFEFNEFQFGIEKCGDTIYALLMERRAGIISAKCDMISDWLSRGEPIRLYLNTYTEGQDCKLCLVFYKDKSAAHKWREQSVVPLTVYKGRARQEISACLTSKEEVKIGEEYFGNNDDNAVVTYKGEAIGKVPSKIRKRIIEDNYAYAEIEEIIQEENDNGDDVYHPLIRIYW